MFEMKPNLKIDNLDVILILFTSEFDNIRATKFFVFYFYIIFSFLLSFLGFSFSNFLVILILFLFHP